MIIVHRFIKKHFQNADKDNSGTVELQECMAVAKQLNTKLSENEILERFKVILCNYTGFCNVTFKD